MQSSMDMGTLSDWDADTDDATARETVEEMVWGELGRQGHDMTGRLVWE